MSAVVKDDLAELIERLEGGVVSEGEDCETGLETFDIDDANAVMRDAAKALKALMRIAA